MEEEKPKKQYLFIALVIIFLILAVLLWLFGKDSDNGLNQGPTEPSEQEPAENTLPEEARPGDVGETLESTTENGTAETPLAPLPDIISSTAGIVLSKEGTVLIVRGTGNNFVDGMPRELRCIFTEDTITLDMNGKEYQGNIGLAVLKKDMQVFIDGAENLRGKTEFKARQVMVIY